MCITLVSLIKNGSSLERRSLLFVAGTMMTLFFFACANVVSPTGGPRDEDPPVVIRSLPPNYSSNFEADQVRIFFDEFIVLDNPRQQLLVSPPLEIDPEIRIKGRSLVIDIEDQLRANTTYNIFLGDAVRDNTEGNAIPNFQFVFSTGDYVDSLSLGGQVVDAFDLEPQESVYVMLYDSIYDSIPYKERPVYLSKTDEEGMFFITNMKEGEFLMFALVDNNANFLYDLPDEKIAFLDSLVVPRYVTPIVQSDTVTTEGGDEGMNERGDEEASGQEDEEMVGRVHERASERGDEEWPFYTLYLFQERDTVQRVVSKELVRNGQIRLTFRVPYDSICFRDIRGELNETWYMPEFSANRDSLNIWFTDLQQDSLFLEVYDGLQLLDTVELSTTVNAPKGRRASDNETEEQLPEVSLGFGDQSGRTIAYFKPLSAKASAPLKTIDHEKITAFISDTIPLDVTFEFSDALQRRITMAPGFEENVPYQIEFLPGALTDIFGATNDTIQRSFRTDSNEDYGILAVNVDLSQLKDLTSEETPVHDSLIDKQDVVANYILQLLDKNGIPLDEKHFRESGMFSFPHLKPDNYSFRLIEDRNNNMKWDTGLYLKGILPERVFMYGETLQVRQNWEMEENWVVGSR